MSRAFSISAAISSSFAPFAPLHPLLFSSLIARLISLLDWVKIKLFGYVYLTSDVEVGLSLVRTSLKCSAYLAFLLYFSCNHVSVFALVWPISYFKISTYGFRALVNVPVISYQSSSFSFTSFVRELSIHNN